jgi:hypothetical protein
MARGGEGGVRLVRAVERGVTKPDRDERGRRAAREQRNGGGGSGAGGPLWCHGPTAGRCGPVRGKWKMGPTQEAQCRFHIYSKIFQKNRIDLIKRGPSRALKNSNKI